MYIFGLSNLKSADKSINLIFGGICLAIFWASPFGNAVNKIFIYTCHGKIRDIKDFQKADSETMILLNPLCVLKMAEKENVNLYNTLALAETGNAFGKIDVWFKFYIWSRYAE